MTWTDVSVVGNVVMLVVIAILALDRVHFRKNCELRHNPIDAAVDRIEAGIKGMRAEVKKDFQRVWEAIDKLRER